MRTTKRFTPKVLDRFRRIERGTGVFDNYIPWHRVSRSDPASYGQSHLIKWNKRHIELLSNEELTTFCFATRLIKSQDDIREQLPLSLNDAPHELAAYDVRFGTKHYPGTLQIADELGIKHPMTYGDGLSAEWVMSTDQLLMIKGKHGNPELLALSTKDKNPLTKRKKALLKIEQTYWQRRGVQWLLITPHLYHPLVKATLHRTWPWALHNLVSEDLLVLAADAIHRWHGHSLTFLLNKLAEDIGHYTTGQHALWQSIWSGRVPVDLRRGWRPHIPLQIISQEAFDSLNPVFMRRSYEFDA